MSEKFIPIENFLKKDDSNDSKDAMGFSKFPPGKGEDNVSHHLTNKACQNSSEPGIIVHREGNRVSYVILKCSCGREYKLNCVYTVPSS